MKLSPLRWPKFSLWIAKWLIKKSCLKPLLIKDFERKWKKVQTFRAFHAVARDFCVINVFWGISKKARKMFGTSFLVLLILGVRVWLNLRWKLSNTKKTESNEWVITWSIQIFEYLSVQIWFDLSYLNHSHSDIMTIHGFAISVQVLIFPFFGSCCYWNGKTES